MQRACKAWIEQHKAAGFPPFPSSCVSFIPLCASPGVLILLESLLLHHELPSPGLNTFPCLPATEKPQFQWVSMFFPEL